MNASETTLIVVPGLTGPFSSAHRLGYEFLSKGAAVRGYRKIIVQALPGQADAFGIQTGRLNFASAVASVRQRLDEEAKGDVRLCGISFGCGVAVSALNSLRDNDALNRISVRLWGPIPLWQSWKAFWQGPKPEQLGRETKFCDHREFYSDLQALEVALPEIRAATQVCMGSLDEYNPPVWLDYLRALCSSGREKPAVEVLNPIPGCHHNVRPDKDSGCSAYLDFMLN